MRATRLCIVLIVGLLSCWVLNAADQMPWEELLEQAGLTRQSAQLEPVRWHGGSGGVTLGSFDRLWDDWFAVRPYALSLASQALASPQDLPATVALATAQIDAELSAEGIRTIKDTVAARVQSHVRPRLAQGSSSMALVEAIARLHTQYDRPLSDERQAELTQRVEAVPDIVAEAATLMLWTSQRAVQQRNRALQPCAPTDQWQSLFTRSARFANWHSLDAETLQQLKAADLYDMAVGAVQLSAAARQVLELLGSHQPVQEQFAFQWDTPLGTVALGGGGDDVYEAGSYLLIIDTAGNEQYNAGGGTQDASCPVSVLIDIQGDDRYQSSESYAFGAGILGYGLLLDAGGDDTYELDSYGLGMGVVGVGVLLDMAGNDSYDTHHLGQGAAAFGAGLLVDISGDDRYNCYNLAQGYGGVGGCGMLIDNAGSDSYIANDEDIQFPSPQTGEHNTSMAQGVGFGRRAHPGDGRSLAGGVGILVEGGGDDDYSCGVFGQGAAYWYALGMLVDMAGDDRYQGVWYAQGAAAHYAVATLLDEAGNDEHRVSMYTSLGAGHDYSIGQLWNEAGDDLYQGPVTLGWGNANGIGVFVDGAGADRYQVQRLGAASSSRAGQRGLGLFVDGGGEDEWPEDDALAQPGTKWIRPEPGHDSAWGLGLDR